MARFFILPLLLVSLSLLALPEKQVSGQEIGFLEDYVLAEDRKAALEELVPGTESYYYFHCLYFQSNRQLDQVEAKMKDWKKRLGETKLYKQIRNRQMLLIYPQQPQVTLAYVEKQLGLNFNHQREIPQAQRKLPSVLDPSKLAWKAKVQNALKRRDLDQFTDAGLRLLVDQSLTKLQRRQLLSRLKRPDFPGLVEIVAAELQEKDAQSFGRLSIHRSMTIEQLDRLAQQRPRIKTESGFVDVYISKLYPSNDVNWIADDEQRQAYLDRLWNFVSTLSPSFNSLKANVLYQRLQLDMQAENYNRARFMEYLKLPRNAGYVNQDFLKRIRQREQIAQLGKDYSGLTMLPPIRDDQSLVKHYLSVFLREADDYLEYEPYIRDTFLKQQFAETKILAGLGDVEKWASMLSADRYKALLDRIDIEFALNAPKYLKANDQVALDVHLKNVDKLIVKVFEINTGNYYRRFRKEIDTDINLDGLVPNFEKTYEYDTPPAVRKRRTFEFPELAKRGVYVIDFIAGGKSSRALIRKGRLQVVESINGAGHSMVVVDEEAKAVKDVYCWLAGRRYAADENGAMQIPFSTQPGSVQLIVTQGDFSTLHRFQHLPESYDFRAAMVLDRENLTRGNTAKLLIRPSLQVAGACDVPVGLLNEHVLTVTTKNLDGITATKTITEFQLDDSKETVCEFMVPPRLASISVNLKTQLESLSTKKTLTFNASDSFMINQIDTSEQIQDFHLVPSRDGYFLEVLGKTGETRPGQAVRVGFLIQGLKNRTYVDLQSDENGLIVLGRLDHIRAIEISPTVGRKKAWDLATQDQTYSQTIHVAKGETIQIPAPAGVTETDAAFMSIFEKRSGQLVRNAADSASVEDGLIQIKNLAPGDYDLRIEPPVDSTRRRTVHQILIRVSDGTNVGDAIVKSSRHFQRGNDRKVQIGTIQGDQKTVRIELENITKNTRVHLVASRYQPAFDVFGEFASIRGIEPWYRVPADRRSAYQMGRKIGDEYDYILRRKYAAKFPGNMLTRPSLLLNPWSPRDTKNNAQDASKGDLFGRAGNDRGGATGRAKPKKSGAASTQDFANLDFLGEGSVVLTNLRPNKAGIINIDRGDLKKNQHIRVLVVEGAETVQRNANLDLQPLTPRDGRLANGLDPELHFSQSKQTDLLSAGKSVRVDDLVSAKFQQYDDLSDAYTLLQSLGKQAYLNDFRFVLEWNDKKQTEKQTLYSKYVCHELNFFIFKKDKAFFNSVVLPHLKNKRTKTFMDKYLLGENLESYTQPWKFSRLNTLEKILLSQRLEDRSNDLIRSLNESYLIAPTPRKAIDRFYDSTLAALSGENSEFKSRQLKTSTASKLGELRKSTSRSLGRAKEKAVAQSYPAPGGLGGGGFGGGGFGGGRAAGTKNVPRPSSATSNFGVNMDEASDKLFVVQNGKQTNRGRADFSDNGIVPSKNEEGFWDPMHNVKKGESLKRLREKQTVLYRRIDTTKEWIESNYYRLTPEKVTPGLVPMNQFWRDYANHQGGTFLSPNFAEAHSTFTSGMLALAVLDLPFEAANNEMKFADSSMTFNANGPAIVLHQQVKKANFVRGNTKILVSENFFQKNDRYRFENGIQYDKFISDEFLAHTLYGSQVVITNPTSTPREVELLIQIPEGAMACSGSQETKTELLSLEPFTTKTFEYFFYFPAEGQFKHYPAHVSAKEQVLAVADGIGFNVVDRQAELDKESWEFVSQNGSDDQVIDFINNKNVKRLDLSKIAFRMKDKKFYRAAIATLKNRYVYDTTLWSYAVKHNDAETIKEFLTHTNPISQNVGIEFASALLDIDPTERNWYAHKEYWPLVNARAHQLGPQRKILNPDFAAQYKNMLTVLSQHRELSADDYLVMTYYLLLQDRIEAALDHFSKVSESNITSKMQYDYCDAYLDFYRGRPEAAATKASMWADYPVDRWRKRFEAIVAQVAEIKGDQVATVDEKDPLQQQTELAAKSESIDLEVAAGAIKLSHQNVKSVQVNFYEMDIELLFSRSPFAQDDLDGFSLIRPNATRVQELDSDEKGRGNVELQLPESMKNKNVLVEVVAGDQVRSQPFFAHSLDVKMQENYGQLQVLEQDSGKMLSRVYVKVYARMADGSVRFHKDGYTDLRGRFDYVTQSNRSPNGIQRLSVLVLSGQNGAVLRQANMPKE